MKKILGCLIALAFTFCSSAQNNRYIVTFKNKGSGSYSIGSPSAFLSQRSLDRRSRYNIPIDSTDLPISTSYLDSVRLAGNVTIINRSKWLNSVSIFTTDATAITKISSFSFVLSVSSIAPRQYGLLQENNKFELEENPGTALPRPVNILDDYFNYGASYNQVHIHNGEFLHNIGLRGQGMVIGMLDAGFQNYLTVKAFDSVRANGQILGIYDFYAKDSSVNEDNSHGMQCFSTIAANIPGQFVGTAPKASFYLFRSEDAVTEYPFEEHNWVCAAERVDSVGGDLISSSLGYNMFDPPFTAFSHTYAEMNGNTTWAAKGADLAAKKGVLVVNSAGNEGNNTWHYIITPADGDSVLAVGAVNGAGNVASFSSYGPSSDGQVKPDVASVGVQTVVQLPNNAIGTNNGTSFAGPNMAGLATCLWQGFREFPNMKIIQALRQSGSIASAPNDRIGYGIPDMKKATLILLQEFATASATLNNCKTNITWNSKDLSAMKYEIERMDPGQPGFVKIAEQQGTGSIFTNHSYNFSDQLSGVAQGIISYRIRQVIDTASTGFSAGYLDTITVNNAANCAFTVTESFTLMPNPALNDFFVRVNLTDPMQRLVIRVFNGKGQLVHESVKNKGTGVSSYAVPVYHLPKGKYYVTLYNDSKKIATKELIRL